MGKYRTLSESNQYYLPKHTYLVCIHYALQYRDWKAELDANRDTRGAIRYDKDKIQTSNDYDSTSETAMRMVEIEEKCHIIDECIHTACDASNLDSFVRLCAMGSQCISFLTRVCRAVRTCIIQSGRGFTMSYPRK